MKATDIMSSAASNMMRSKLRTILTITAIVIGAFTITMTVGISSGISTYIDEQLDSVGAADVLVVQRKVEVSFGSGPQKYDPEDKSTSGRAAMMNSTLKPEDIEAIASQKGIRDVRPWIVVSPEYITGKNGEKYQIEVQPVIESMNFQYVAGRLPNNASDTKEILLPVTYVSVLGFGSGANAVGKDVTVTVKTPAGEPRSVKAKIAGIQEESLLSQGGASANDALVDALFAIQTENLPAELANRYLGAVARFDSTISEEELQTIKDGLSDKGYDGQTVKDQIGVVKQVIDAVTYILLFFGAIALVAASFGIINTLFMSVQERTKEIGLMKAMGMSRSKVFALFSVEAILLGFWGSTIGILIAMGAGQVANRIASDSFLKDLPGFDLTVFPVTSVTVIVLVVVGIAFLAGTLPARRAAAQDPIEALRYE